MGSVPLYSMYISIPISFHTSICSMFILNSSQSLYPQLSLYPRAKTLTPKSLPALGFYNTYFLSLNNFKSPLDKWIKPLRNTTI